MLAGRAARTGGCPVKVSVVLPAKDEAASIGAVLAAVRVQLPDAELIVVDDGSSDDTGRIAATHGARVIRHETSRGNGAAIKAGARRATGDVLVFMDADGQHDPADIPALLKRLEAGADLAIGARSARSQASFARLLGNAVYNRLAGWMVGQRIDDLTSGFRAVRAAPFREFLYLLPNGFSYPTTSTMAFFRAGYSVAFVPIEAGRRQGRGHIRLLRDGARFLVIIFKVGTLYSPLKIFAPISVTFFIAGLGYSTYTLVEMGRFTNFGALMFSLSILVFLIGLVSEQITTLIYKA